MYNKLFVSILIVTSSFVLAIGQTPDASKDKDKVFEVLSLALGGDGGYLGVQTVEVGRDNFAKFGLREVRGVAVEKVVENSPAAAAGLKDGDVIVRFNGDEVTSARKLTRLVSEVDPDHQVRLAIIRNGSEQELNVTVGKRPTAKFGEGRFEFAMPTEKMEMPDFKELQKLKEFPQLKEFREFKDFQKDFPNELNPNGENKMFTWRAGEGRQIGVGVSPLTKQLAGHFGVEAGMLINEVRENSPAAKAGLKAGDIIVEVEGKAVKGEFDLMRTINGKKEGDISVTYVRDGKRQTVSITPEPSKDSGFLFRTQNGEGADFTSPAPIRIAPLTRLTGPSVKPMTAFRFGRII